jgi:hypothetical protein
MKEYKWPNEYMKKRCNILYHWEKQNNTMLMPILLQSLLENKKKLSMKMLHKKNSYALSLSTMEIRIDVPQKNEK